jgi:outer membrane protein assembly factor BamD
MHHNRWLRLGLILSGALSLGCASGFKLTKYTTSESLYSAAMAQYQNKKWDNAILAFEKLTLELPARDTLLPSAHFYLAKAHAQRGDHLLAAQAYNRMSESFATDSLADDAMFEAGMEYERLWRKPVLDAQYGGEALTTFQTLLSLYPDSPLSEKTVKEIARMQEWFATKDFETAMYYFRRKAYDPALIYFRDVVRLYPETDRARESYLRMAEAYGAIKWKDDKTEVCKTLRERYPKDRQVPLICGAPVVASDSATRDDP